MKSVLLSSIAATYSVAALIREFLPGLVGWLIGLMAFHMIAALALRFLTNAKWFAACVAIGAVSIEALTFRCFDNISIAILVGTLLELIPATYFARRLFLAMGD